MADDACPLPKAPGEDEAGVIARLVRAKRVAVVGLSDDPMRPSFGVASYLLSEGVEVIPVNPNHATVLGRKSYRSLREVPGPIDLVDVFRRPEHCGDVAREAVSVGAKGIWLQSGIVSPDARQVAAAAGVDYVEDRCLMVDHMRAAQ